MYIPESQENAELVCCTSTHLSNKGPSPGLCIIASVQKRQQNANDFSQNVYKNISQLSCLKTKQSK